MPFFSIRNLFTFRKTMATANAPPVLKLNLVREKDQGLVRAEATSILKQTQAPVRTHANKRTRKNNSRSIFARLTSSFKALSFRKQNRSKPEIETISKGIETTDQNETEIETIGKEIENTDQNETEIETIGKEIKNSIPDFKTSVSLKLANLVGQQDLIRPTDKQAIFHNYTQDFQCGKKTFTDKNGLVSPKDQNPEALAEHLTNFCGGDENQASTLSALLTPTAVTEITEALLESSPTLNKNKPRRVQHTEMDVHMKRNNTARIAITRKYLNHDPGNTESPITVKTTIVVPRKNPGTVIFEHVYISTPKLTEKEMPLPQTTTGNKNEIDYV